MIKDAPRVLAYKSIFDKGNFILYDLILNKNHDDINLFKRLCPHRMYPIGNVGEHIEEIECSFHGYKWTATGSPINNDKNIMCGKASIGNSGLVIKNFVEPGNFFTNELAKEKNLKFSHCLTGSSVGSWLWMMEIQTDLLHIRKGKNVIHPELSKNTNLNEIEMFEGDNWIIQKFNNGWWCVVYPYTFIEYSKGCLGINQVCPTSNNEYGFNWTTQFYYDPIVSKEKRSEFETLEDVFKEDVIAIEKIKTPFFPLKISKNKLENHCVHFGNWIKNNLKKTDKIVKIL